MIAVLALVLSLIALLGVLVLLVEMVLWEHGKPTLSERVRGFIARRRTHREDFTVGGVSVTVERIGGYPTRYPDDDDW